MKILAVNGSPLGENGNTQVLLNAFLKGCEQEGSETEIIYLKDKSIKHCCGCFSCWTKTPGKCIYNDDMEELLGKIISSDMIVYATPLYYYTVTGLMKDFMDRMLPLNNKEIVKTGDTYSHTRRIEDHPVKTVLISNCGFPGKNNFSALLETFKVMTNGNLTAAILCPQGGILRAATKNETLIKIYAPFFEALKSAGSEVIKLGHIEPVTQAVLEHEVIDPEIYVENANKNWM